MGWTTESHNGSQPPAGIEGSSSYITTNGTALCQTDYAKANFSNSYNMVHSGSHNWAQSGFIYRATSGCKATWVQQALNDDFVEYDDECTSSGELHAYRNVMVYSSTQHRWYVDSEVDGVVLLRSYFDPFAEWAQPFQIQFMGETTHPESDVPGSQSNKTNISGMGAQRYSDNRVVTTCGNAYLGVYRPDNRYGVDSVSCSHVRVWTNL